MNRWHLKQAVKVISTGGVIAYPTEAVYGLGCNPGNIEAVCKILQLKNRNMEKGLILVAANTEQLEDYIYFPSSKVRDRVTATWPGPVTWVIPAKPSAPPWVTGSHNTVAVRVSSHPMVQQLCKLTGALVSTSANPGGYPPAKTAFQVLNYFGDSLDYILHGTVAKLDRPTVIMDSKTGNILRT